MNVDQASKVIILKPYITEKTFAMVENENKICFIVERSASKPQIMPRQSRHSIMKMQQM